MYTGLAHKSRRGIMIMMCNAVGDWLEGFHEGSLHAEWFKNPAANLGCNLVACDGFYDQAQQCVVRVRIRIAGPRRKARAHLVGGDVFERLGLAPDMCQRHLI